MMRIFRYDCVAMIASTNGHDTESGRFRRNLLRDARCLGFGHCLLLRLERRTPLQAPLARLAGPAPMLGRRRLGSKSQLAWRLLTAPLR